MSHIDRKLAAIAATQHSLVTLQDVVNAGGDKKYAARRAAAGRWEHVFETVYRIAGVAWTYEAKVLALVLAAGEGAVASHFCAMRLLGLGFRHAPPEISIPRGRNHRPDGYLVHTSTDLDRCNVVRRHGIPITDPARTLLDVARKLRGTALVNAVEEARRHDLATWHDLIACVSTHARRGRAGIRRMREVIAGGVTNDGITDTDSELAALGLLRENGYDEPRLQFRIYEDDGARLVAEMDLAYPLDKVNFEIDGDVHLQDAVRLKDEKRDHMLRTVYGWTIRRIWWTIPVREPDLFLQIVKGAFEEARSRRRG
jgi:hypothetical protein